MLNVINLMKHVLETLQIYGKYQILFYFSTGYLILTLHEAKEEKTMQRGILYFVIAGFLLVYNPLFVGGLIQVFPQLNTYWELLFIMPVYLIISYAAVLIMLRFNKNQKKYEMVYLVAFLLLFALAGTVDPFHSKSLTVAENAYGIPHRQMEVLERLSKEDGVLLLAPDDIISGARRVSGELHTIYGRTMWSETVPKDTLEGYEQVCYELYAYMQAPTGYEEEITSLARKLDCTYLVISNGTIEQEQAEIPRDPNAIVDLSVDSKLWCRNGFELIDETECYYILRCKEEIKENSDK